MGTLKVHIGHGLFEYSLAGADWHDYVLSSSSDTPITRGDRAQLVRRTTSQSSKTGGLVSTDELSALGLQAHRHGAHADESESQRHMA